LDKESKTKKFSAKIVSVETLDEKTTRLTFKDKLNVCVGDVCENYSSMPKVIIKNCKTGGNRPRGFLIATNKKAVVKNCVFYNSECGVGVFADTDFWFESGAVKNIIVKGCSFYCNYGGETSAVSVKPSVKKGKDYFNGKITVKNCKFDCSYGDAVNIFNTKKVVLKNNLALDAKPHLMCSNNVKMIDCGK
jgi:hypothetical protein